MPEPVDKHKVGLYNKFEAPVRTDGRSAPGEKHHGCQYFLLDMTHDPFAVEAVAAYARACQSTYPLLAADLLKWVESKTPNEEG